MQAWPEQLIRNLIDLYRLSVIAHLEKHVSKHVGLLEHPALSCCVIWCL